MKKIVILGGKGQLGQCFRKISSDYDDQHEFIFVGSDELDITDEDAVHGFFSEQKPQVCINAAAYTAVDKAEQEPGMASAINGDAVRYIAEACKQSDALLIHISTDYVFDGETNISYSEDNFTNPQGVYGATKLQGEEYALEYHSQSVIIRTSWLYSEFAKNFVKTMLRLFGEKEEIGVVADQFGQPTYAVDLAKAIMTIINAERKVYGVFHFSNYPETTWYHFAQKIAEITESSIKINSIATTEFPTPARRPMRSTMALDKIEETYGVELRHWETALEECLAEIQMETV